MYRLALAAALFFGATAAQATGTPKPSTPAPTPAQPPVTQVTSVQSSPSAQAGAWASGSASSQASGGSVSFEEFSRSNLYVLPAPVQAAPLPPGLCPQGDSMSIGILWNMFSYSRSSTRTEMECLDKVLAGVRQLPRVEVVQAPTLAPTAAPEPEPIAAAPIASSSAASAPAAKPVQKAVIRPKAAPKKMAEASQPSCGANAVMRCEVKR